MLMYQKKVEDFIGTIRNFALLLFVTDSFLTHSSQAYLHHND